MRNPYSASQLGRRWLCPGSAKAEAGLPEVHSAESDSGTRIHRYVSIQGDLRHTIELTDDEREVAEEWLRFRGEFGLGWVYENYMQLRDPNDGTEVTNGTADAVACPTESSVLVIDLKTGYQPIPKTIASFQLSVYLAMAMQSFDASEGTAYIYQPRIGRRYQVTMRDTDIPALVEKVKGIISACESRSLDINPSAEACRFCRARHTCPGPRSLSHPLIEHEDLTRVPEARLAELWEFWKVVKKQGESLDKIFRVAVREGRVEGYEMRERRGNRYFPSVRRVYQRLKDTIPAEEFLELCSLSPAKLERAYVERISGPNVSKAQAGREFVGLTQDVTDRGKPKEMISKVEEYD